MVLDFVIAGVVRHGRFTPLSGDFTPARSDQEMIDIVRDLLEMPLRRPVERQRPRVLTPSSPSADSSPTTCGVTTTSVGSNSKVSIAT